MKEEKVINYNCVRALVNCGMPYLEVLGLVFYFETMLVLELAFCPVRILFLIRQFCVMLFSHLLITQMVNGV